MPECSAKRKLKIRADNCLVNKCVEPNSEQSSKSKYKNRQTKTYSDIRTVNFYYQEYLIHLAHVKNIMVTIFLDSTTNIELAKEISTDIAVAFEKLNAKIPDIRSHCQ